MNTLFENSYKPTRPFASNAPKLGGVRRYSKADALGMQFIQPNVPTMRNLFVVDVDADGAAWDLKDKIFEDGILPLPAAIIENPVSTHAHAVWVLDGFAKSERAIATFESQRRKLTILAGGDPAYGGNLFRNPLWEDACTEFFEDAKPLTFSALHNYTGEIVLPSRKKIVFDEEEGRNNFLFKKGADWAYANYLNALKEKEEAFFAEKMLNYMITENMLLGDPLSLSEIKGIAKSIMRFLKEKFSIAKFERKMEARRAKSLEIRSNASQAKYFSILDGMLVDGLTKKAACEKAGVGYAYARSNWRKWQEQYGEA